MEKKDSVSDFFSPSINLHFFAGGWKEGEEKNEGLPNYLLNPSINPPFLQEAAKKGKKTKASCLDLFSPSIDLTFLQEAGKKTNVFCPDRFNPSINLLLFRRLERRGRRRRRPRAPTSTTCWASPCRAKASTGASWTCPSNLWGLLRHPRLRLSYFPIAEKTLQR